LVVEDYLARYPELAEEKVLVLELILAEQRLRLEREPSVDLDEYQRRFPQYRDAMLAHMLTTPGPPQATALHTPETRPEPRRPPLPPGDETPGERIGRYELHGEVARGGMGAVLRAHDPDLGRDLAIKVLLEKHRDQPDMQRRFVEEARVGGQLQHPGIVPVHEISRTDDGRPFFTMKLVKGRTLGDLLAERPTPRHDLPRFLDVFQQVCQTVAYAHSRGVIHRDLKPSNVMVGAFGEVQVMDWGLAKVLNTTAAEERPAGGSVVRTGRSGPEGLESQAGSVLGTPAYMAPEQACGQVEVLDERCDVFGLGAILCEILTGLPPYTGQSSAEMQRRAARADQTDAVNRLAACGADAELVRLARECLAPEPADRPRNANVVAERVTAYRAGLQEQLQAAERERAAAQARAEAAAAKVRAERWARRLAVGLVASLLLTTVLAGGTWLLIDKQRTALARAEMVRAIDADLQEASRLQEQGRWAEARLAVQHAEDRLPSNASADLRDRVVQVQGDQAMIARLEEIRLQQARVKDNRFDVSSTDRAYREAFRQYGLDVEADDPAAAEARLGASSIRDHLLAALDDWASIKMQHEGGDHDRLLALAHRVDTDKPRSRVREVLLGGGRLDPQMLRELARDAERAPLPPASLLLLSRGLIQARLFPEAVKLLREGQRRWPADFWINFQLANCLQLLKPPRHAEAVGYYRAALALRPESAAVRLNLGVALQEQGELVEAVAAFREAVQIQPDLALAHNNLGVALQKEGKLGEAIAAYQLAIRLEPDAVAFTNLGDALRIQGHPVQAETAFREAIQLRPDYTLAWTHLGTTIQDQGRRTEAENAFREALRRDPDDSLAFNNLGLVLLQQGKVEEGVAAYREAIRLNPKDARAHANLGNALKDKGRLDEAIAHYQQVLEIDPKNAQAHINLGNTLQYKGRLDAAIGHFRQALLLDPKNALAHINLGNAVAAKGRLDEAIAEYQQAVQIDPRLAQAHGGIGQALLAQGRFEEAQAADRRCLELIEPRHPLHPLMTRQLQQCERLLALEARLPGVLRGDDKPVPTERLALADLCARKKLDGVAARLYAEAFAADPKLADDLRASHRYNAACAAALVGCGQSADAPKVDNKERTRLRSQALDWLRADLTALAKTTDRAVIQRTLQHWQRDADLAGVRDKDALTKLPEGEAKAWQKLWAEVASHLRR
jgi:serine/threonine-protein kinase